MSATERRTVITGLGAVTPLGTGNDAFWQALLARKSGVLPLEAFDVEGLTTTIGAEVRDFDPKHYVKQRKSLKVMARDIQLAVGAAQLVIDDAGIDPTKVDSPRFGVSCGAAMIASELDELGAPVSHSMNGSRRFDLKKWGTEGMEQLFPLWMLKYLPNMPACHISIFYDAQGPNNTITVGESSATLAMGEAYRILQRGSADIFVTGGTDSKIHPLSFCRLLMLNRLSRRNGDPSAASRPFDAERDGLVAGEGAALFVFEELTHAKKRGAKIMAEVIGFGRSCYPTNVQRGIETAIRSALKDAGITPAELGHIVPSAAGLVKEDAEEAKALANILGDAVGDVPIVPYKSLLGHTYAGSGAVELAASVLGCKNQILTGAINYEKPDSDLPALRVLTENIDFPNKPFLVCSVSHSGQCGALVVRPYDGD